MRIPIVNEQDELIEYKDIDERKDGEICRVSALWVTNEKGEILLAKRALVKKREPGLWGPAVAGTVEEGETYESNIIKEAAEEIGLTNFLPKEEKKVRRSTSHEYFNQWFSAQIDSEYIFRKKDDEVDEVRWFTKDEVLEFYKENPEKFVPSFILTINSFILKKDNAN